MLNAHRTDPKTLRPRPVYKDVVVSNHNLVVSTSEAYVQARGVHVGDSGHVENDIRDRLASESVRLLLHGVIDHVLKIVGAREIQVGIHAEDKGVRRHLISSIQGWDE